MKLQNYSRISLTISVLAFAAVASASSITFNFGTILTGDTPGGSNIATLTIADSGANSVLVTLSHNATSAAGQFISDVWMNLNPYVVVAQSGQTPSNKFSGGLTQGLNTENNAGYNFDLRQGFGVSNAGGGVNRLNPGESVSFTLNGVNLNANLFNATAPPTGGQRADVLAMIHVQGLANGGSVKLGAVPEPASMTALGLGALALIRRRRNSK